MVTNKDPRQTIVEFMWEAARRGNLLVSTSEIRGGTAVTRDQLQRSLALLVNDGTLGELQKGRAQLYYLGRLRQLADENATGQRPLI